MYVSISVQLHVDILFSPIGPLLIQRELGGDEGIEMMPFDVVLIYTEAVTQNSARKHPGVDEFEFKNLNFRAGFELIHVEPGTIPFWTCKAMMR